MRQPQSIRFHLAAVFLFFFALVVVLGSFSIWRLSNFNLLSADVAEVWLPTTRALGDLNNYTSDFRAVEGGNLLSSDPVETGASEKEMEALDRAIAASEREFEAIRRDPAETELYNLFKARWEDYREIVNEMLALSRSNRKDDASENLRQFVARGLHRGQRHTRAAHRPCGQPRSDRGSASRCGISTGLLADHPCHRDRRHSGCCCARSCQPVHFRAAPAIWPIACAALPLPTPTAPFRGTGRRDEIGEMAQATVVFRNNALELMPQPADAGRARLRCSRSNWRMNSGSALMQRNFVSMASHEFRTPLTVIDGHARRLDKTKEAVKARRDRRARRQDP